MTLKQRFLDTFGGPIIHYLWIWRFIIIFDQPPAKRFWSVESVTLYDRTLERPVKVMFQHTRNSSQ